MLGMGHCTRGSPANLHPHARHFSLFAIVTLLHCLAQLRHVLHQPVVDARQALYLLLQ